MVAAVSFGAPFWFDLLVKLVNIRNVGNKPASDKAGKRNAQADDLNRS